jgi:hypothetical protein
LTELKRALSDVRRQMITMDDTHKKEMEENRLQFNLFRREVISKFEEQYNYINSLSEKHARELLQVKNLSNLEHVLQVSLSGLIQKKIESFPNTPFEWERGNLGGSNPREFYMQHEVEWKAVDKALRDLSDDLPEELMNLRNEIGRKWEEHFPTDVDIGLLLDREKHFFRFNSKYRSFGQKMFDKISQPLTFLRTGGSCTYYGAILGAATFGLTAGLAVAFTGGGAVLFSGLLYKAHERDTADFFVKLQLNIIGHCIFLSMIRKGDDPKDSLEIYNEFNEKAQKYISKKKRDAFIKKLKGAKEGISRIAIQPFSSIMLQNVVESFVELKCENASPRSEES